MGRPRPSTNASGHGEEPQPALYPPQEPYGYAPPTAANADVPHYPPEGDMGPTQPPVQYPPEGGMGPTQLPVQYPPEGGMGRTQPPVQYPPEGGMGPTQPPVQYPPEGDMGRTQPPVQYPPEGCMGPTQPPVQYPPGSGAGGAQPVQYPPPSPLRTPVMGTPVPFPPRAGPQQVAMIQQNKDDAAAAAAAAAFAYAANAAGTEQWSSELFDCDMSQDYAIATAICPCVTFGQIAEIVDEGQTSCLLAGMLYMVMIPALFTCSVLSSGYRQKIRQKYSLVEAPSDDCSVHLINPCCALCQEYRELQSKGFDPSLGWIANLALAQQQQETAMYPPGNQYMSR